MTVLAFKAEPGKRRVMTEFVLNEISAVDKPAQKLALARIIKHRDYTATYESGLEVRAAAARPPTRVPLEEVTVAKSKLSEPGSFADAVTQIAYADGAPRHVAMVRARTRFPDLFAISQAQGEDEAAAARPARKVAKAVTDFNSLATTISAIRGISLTAAFAAARQEHPGAFSALQDS